MTGGGTLRIQTPAALAPLLQPSRYKGAWGGRGSGKSWFFGELLIERCVMEPETRFACIREVQKSLHQSVKRLLEDTIVRLGVGHKFRVRETHIESGREGRVIFQGMQNHTAESIKSLEGYHGAWVEEAQSLSQRSLDLLRPTIRTPGSEIWFSWNPNKKTDPVDRLLRGPAPPADAIVVRANYRDNPWLPDELRREALEDRRRDPDKYAHVWLGGYQVRSEARVFRNWRVEPFETPADAVFYLGADWGFAQDPTVLVRCFIVGRDLYIDREVAQVGCEIADTPALWDRLVCGCTSATWCGHEALHGWARAWPVTADSSRPETISHMRAHGYPRIRPSVKGPGSIEEGVKFLQGYSIIVHPRCPVTIDELSLYSYKTDRLTGDVLPVLEDQKNHVIDALRYALEAARRARPAVATVPAAKW